jgi:hypothetical protein
MTDAWMRQTRVRRAAFRAFAHDRDQGAEWAGNRTGRSVVEGVGVDRALLGRWSSRHRWVERAQACDMDLESGMA